MPILVATRYPAISHRPGMTCHSERGEESGSFTRRGQIPRRYAPRNDTREPHLSTRHSAATSGMTTFLLGLFTAFMSSSASGQDEARVLNPVWDRAFEHGIEWCAPVGGEPGTALLVCTKRARLDLLDLKTGQSRLTATISVQSGTRFAGGSGQTAYCYGPSRVYALRVSSTRCAENEGPGLGWQVAGAPYAQTEGDPEFMTRLVAAKPTPKGVLVVRSDGRVAELRREDGNPRWKHELPKTASCTLHVCRDTAALLWKDGDAFAVAFFDLEAQRPRPTVRRISAALPIWTTLLDEGLVSVWRKRFGLISPEREVRLHQMHRRVGASASTVAVYFPGTRASRPLDGEDTTEPVSVILASGDGLACAYDVASGALRWPDREALNLLVGTERAWSLRVEAEYTIAIGSCWFTVYRADCGTVLASYHCPVESTLLGAGLNEGFAYGLFRKGADAFAAPVLPHEIHRDNEENGGGLLGERLSSAVRPRPIDLVRQIMVGHPWPRPHEPVDPEPRQYRLGQAGLILDTFWLGDTLVVVEAKRIRAYTLP